MGTGQSNDDNPDRVPKSAAKVGRITVPANLVFRRKIWGARDNGIPPRSTPVYHSIAIGII